MKDHEIVALYCARSEEAIKRTDEQYGDYCRAIASRVLKNCEDTEECVNDTYFQVWNAIPPKQPSCFRLFIAKITRNAALDLFRKRHADKRYNDQIPLVLEELDACIPSHVQTEAQVDEALLIELLDRFLDTLPPREKWAFSRRYWNMDSVKDIADRLGMTQNYVKVMLHRTRRKLLAVLEKEGFDYALG